MDDEQKASKSDSRSLTDADIKRFGIIPSRRGGQPVTDWESFLASLPRFTHEEVDALWEAIAENRAMRRALAEEKDIVIFVDLAEDDEPDD